MSTFLRILRRLLRLTHQPREPIEMCEQIKACDYHRVVTWSALKWLLSKGQREIFQPTSIYKTVRIISCRRALFYTFAIASIVFSGLIGQSSTLNSQWNVWNASFFLSSLSICCRFVYGLNLLLLSSFLVFSLFILCVFDKRSAERVFSIQFLFPYPGLSLKEFLTGFRQRKLQVKKWKEKYCNH